MRFDTPIYFQRIKSEFEASTGNYNDTVAAEEKRWASVTDSGTNTLTLVYGGLKQGSLTVRLQEPYKSPFDRIMIRGKYYRVDSKRSLLTKHSFVVSEVQ